MIKRFYRKFLFCILFGVSGMTGAGVISVGTIPPLPVAPPIAIDPGEFLVPVQILGALNLQNWGFILKFDEQVVQVVPELSPSNHEGIFEAEFTPGVANSLSDIQNGFPFNFLGLVEVAGAHPDLLPSGPSGDGVLAYILFTFVPEHEGENPNFAIAEQTVFEQQVPEPNTLALFAAALLILTFTPRLRGVRLSSKR